MQGDKALRKGCKMLDKNIIRINGWKDNKRSHIDIKVPMTTVEFSNSEGKRISVAAPRMPYDVAQLGFDNGLDAVTSVNSWNWVGNERLTQKIL